MPSTDEQFARVRLIVRLIYASALLFAALIALGIPKVEPQWGGLQQSFLLSMLIMAVSTFPIAHWISKRFWPSHSLSAVAPESARLPGAAFIMAGLGEACTVYGYALYCISGDQRWPWLFVFLSAGHYAYTMTRLEQAADETENPAG